jgi:hypothetical protein
MPPTHLGYHQGNNGTMADAMKGHLPGARRMSWWQSSRVLPRVFKAPTASPAAARRASSCTIRTEDKEALGVVKTVSRMEASKETRMLKILPATLVSDSASCALATFSSASVAKGHLGRSLGQTPTAHVARWPRSSG